MSNEPLKTDDLEPRPSDIDAADAEKIMGGLNTPAPSGVGGTPTANKTTAPNGGAGTVRITSTG